jgi:O-antigen/teichoic acid export membrane protein
MPGICERRRRASSAPAPERSAPMFRNTLAQAARQFAAQGFSFVLAPIMIARLGLTLFGVWAVVGAIATYATVLDAGITRALTRFVALYDTREDPRAIRECMGLGLCAFTAVGAVMLPASWFAGPPLADALGHVSGIQMSQILIAMAVIFTFQGYNAVLQSLGQGLRLMVAPNVAAIVGNVVNFAASVGALIASRSLVPYAWANAGAETASALIMLFSVRWVWRTQLVALPSRELVREVLGFSLQSQLGWIADLINLQSDKIVIGLVVGAREAGAYQLGSSVALAIRGIGVIAISAMIPTATATITKEGREVIGRLARHYLPRVLGVSLPIFALTALVAPFLFTVWIDRPAEGVIAILIALNAAYAVNIMTGVPSTLSLADGRPGFVSRNSLAMAALNLALTLALAPFFGLAGVVAGTVIAVSSISAVFVVSFARSYGLTASDVRDAILPSTLLAAAVAIPFVPVVVATHHLGSGRLAAAGLLVAFSVGYGAIYWPLASWIGVLPEQLALKWMVVRSTAG